ncbi:MAG: hypothetical protein IPG69_04800 [Flavobacteriales bacterium]|nr:hypothetical protein [Flavobacteriales bacterium]
MELHLCPDGELHQQIITLAAVGIAEEGDLLSSVSLYPVPVADVLNVDLSAAKGTTTGTAPWPMSPWATISVWR